MSEPVSERPTTAELRAEAAKVVKQVKPSELFLACLTFPFLILGWILGRGWYLVAEAIVMCAMTTKYGYWNGAKVPPEQRIRKAPAPNGPVQ
jgi:hypothetical protein